MGMTDRKLLELAAKAAGFVVRGRARDVVSYLPDDAPHLVIANERGGDSVWNPLADDGDALRLLATLRFNVWIGDGSVSVNRGMGLLYTVKFSDGDYTKALREAIVRAAAEIGRGK